MQTWPRTSKPSIDSAEARILVAGRIRWRVLEVLNAVQPHVVLFSASHIRTIRPYPPNWRHMPDEDLFALSTPLEEVPEFRL